jgi:hypothetical protein
VRLDGLYGNAAVLRDALDTGLGLIASLQAQIIAPAEQKARELMQP